MLTINVNRSEVAEHSGGDGEAGCNRGPPLLDMPFASRHPSSPLWISLGWQVLSGHSDADDYKLLNGSCNLSTGLVFIGDCKAHLSRCMEKVLQAALRITMASAAVDMLLEDAVSDPSGPYAGRTFEAFEHVRQQPDFQFTDECRLLGLKQFVIDAASAYPWEDKMARAEVLTHGSVVTEVGGLVVIRGPPPSYHRIPLRLAARVLTLHVNVTFNSTLVLPIDVVLDDLLLAPRGLSSSPPTPAPPPPPAPPSAPLLSLSPASASANRYPINLDGAEPSMTPKKLW